MVGLKDERLKPGMRNYPEQFVFNYHDPKQLSAKEPACHCRRRGFNPWVRKIPWRRKWLPNPVFLPGESHGQGSLFSPWGRKGSDTTRWLKSNMSRHERNPAWGGGGMCPVLLSQCPWTQCTTEMFHAHHLQGASVKKSNSRMKPETQKPVGWHSAVSHGNSSFYWKGIPFSAFGYVDNSTEVCEVSIF